MTKLPIPLSPARTAMVEATGPTSNVPYWLVLICNLGYLGQGMDISSGDRADYCFAWQGEGSRQRGRKKTPAEAGAVD